MITLEQARTGRGSFIDRQVIDSFRRNSLLLDRMVFDDAVAPGGGGSTMEYGYMREKTPAVADFREINKEYQPQETTREKHTVEIKVFGGSYQVDRVIESTGGQYSEIAIQMEAKIKATCSLFHKTVVDGDSETDPRSFDGLDKALRGTSTEINSESYIDISSSGGLDANYKAVMDLLDETLAGLCGQASCIMANTSMITKLKQVARRAGYYTRSEDAFGRSVDGYDNIPFVDMGYYANEESDGSYTERPVIPIVRREIGGEDISGLTDIYIPVISLNAFHGVTVKGDGLIKQYLPDLRHPGAVKKGEVEMLAAVALKNSRGAGVLRNIKIK